MNPTRIIQILIFSIAILISEPIFAQGIYGKVTPQTSDFVKYGEIPVSLYTGKMNLEVPIYEIKDRDFDIPISLVYTSDGFKLNKRSGFAGMDWIINGGGVITREVYGSPDDWYPTELYGQEAGYWVVTQEPSRRYSKTDLWNFNSNIVNCNDATFCHLPFYYNFFADYKQDLFMFNFCGHNGKFIIDNNHNIIVNKKGYKVDFSRFKSQLVGNIIPDTSAIVVTTPDGYVYTFGGDRSALEYTLNFTPNVQLSSGSTKPTILAWHITKITAPNGRTVNFNYVVEDLTQYNTSKYSPIYLSNKEVQTVTAPETGYSYTTISYIATKNAVLESISLDNTSVEFVKSKGNIADSLFYNDGFIDFNNRNYQLDSIRIKYNNQTKYRYGFTYDSRNKRRFLSTISLSDGGQYLFHYNHPNNYDSPSNVLVDYFGYWTSDDPQNPYGLLDRVDYPTGGYSTFAYEANAYGKMVETYISPVNDSVLTNIVESSGETGGVRIREINNYSGNNILGTRKNYYYINGSSPFDYQTRSGILYQSPTFYYDSNGNKVYHLNKVWNRNYNIEEPHIGYSHVLEVNRDTSMTSYTFSDYMTNPDNNKINVKNENGLSAVDIIDHNVNLSNSMSAKRGHLLKKVNYNQQGNIELSEKYIYKYINSGDVSNYNISSDDVIVSFMSMNGGAAVKKYKIENYPLIFKSDSTKGVVKKEYFRYNALDLLCKKDLALANQDTFRTIYKYTNDFVTENSVYQNLSNRNILDLNVEQKEYRNNDLAKTVRNKYSISLINNAPIIDTLKVGLSANSPEARTIYVSYDKYGNPKEVVDENGIRTVYLWGYNGRHIIAEIKNASLSNLQSYFTINGLIVEIPSSDIEPTSADYAILNNIRSSLSNALVTTYEYNPLVGMTSMTDPRGITTIYEYDSQNRLDCVKVKKDNNEIILKKYNYHYAQ